MMLHWWYRGVQDAVQDNCENAHFGSVGGREVRPDLQRPHWVPEPEWPEYKAGYVHACEEMYGEDWATCTFSWVPALTIHPDGKVTVP